MTPFVRPRRLELAWRRTPQLVQLVVMFALAVVLVLAIVYGLAFWLLWLAL